MLSFHQLSPGSVVSVSVGLVDHVGILALSQWGEPTVISNSPKKKGVVEETFAEFSGGKAVKYVGYLGTSAPAEVVYRARAEIGRQWSAGDNCEHFVRRVHGIKQESPQLQMFVSLCILVATFFAARRFA